MNSSLEKIVKALSDNDSKHFTKEFDYKNLELLKQKDTYPYEHMNSFIWFSEKKKLPDEKYFYNSAKDRTTGDNGKKLDGHISDKDFFFFFFL